jgi:DNA-binding Lrp family transcriptional regulator
VWSLSPGRDRVVTAYVLISAEPSRVQELVGELRGLQLADSIIADVHAVTGRFDLIAYVESPDLQSLGN